jgi:pimeloyl-ACP methyl ester carboxylesterase
MTVPRARAWFAPTGGMQRGRPVFVIIHGVGLSHRVYGDLATELSRHGAVIGVDLPGFGGLPTPHETLSVEDQAALVARLLARLGVRRYVVIGHSMGAQVALELSLIDPAGASALALVGPVVDPAGRSALMQGLALARDSAKEPPSTNLRVLRDYLACGMPWFLTQVREMLRYRTDERIELVGVPLLVVRGENDPIASQPWCDWLAARSPRGVSAAIPGHRHVVAHTAPAAVASLVAKLADQA